MKFAWLASIAVLAALISLLSPTETWAGAVITYHGRILDSADRPLESNAVTFRIRVYSPNPGKCLLYEETRTISMVGSNGVFVIPIGDGQGTRSAMTDPGIAMEEIFSNNPNVTLDRNTYPKFTCNTAGHSYTATSLDQRQLSVTFDDQSGAGEQALPLMDVGFVPFAVNSYDAQKIGGTAANSVLRLSSGTATPFSAPQFTELLSLIAGTSTQYSKSNQLNGVNLPVMGNGQALGWNAGSWVATTPLTSETDPSVKAFAKADLPTTCGADKFLRPKADGSGFDCIAPAGGGAGTITEVAAGTGLSGGGTSGSVTVNLTNVGTAGTYYKVTTDAQGRVTNGQGALADTDIPNLPASKITTGTFADSFLAGLSIDKLLNGAGKYFNYKPANTACANSEILRYDTTLNAGAGGWKCSTESGVGAESDPTVQSFAKNAPATGLVVNGSNQLQVDIGNTANKIVQLDGSGKLPVLDGSQLTNLPAGANFSGSLSGDVTGTQAATVVSRINGINAATAVAGDDQKFMKYVHGSGWQPQFVKLSELRNNLGTGSAFNAGIAGCTSAQTLVWSSLTDQFNCQDITLSAAKVTGLATVATSGSYNDLADKPTIPGAQVNADWNAGAGAAQILNKPTLGSLAAKSGVDLSTAEATGILPTSKGGTGLSAAGTGNQILGMNNAATAMEYKTLTAGSGISIAHGIGTVTVAASNSQFPTCGANQYITFNGTTFTCEADAGAAGAVASISSGTSALTFSSSTGAITANISDATTAAKGLVQLAANGGTTAGTVVQANDSRLADSRAPSGTAGGDLDGTYPNPTLKTTTVTPGAYGDATNVATFTVDDKGRLTNAGSAAIPTASGTAKGLLTAADWNTFNGKQDAGNYVTALTGDVTSSGFSAGSVTTVVSNVVVDKISNAVGKYFTYQPNNTACGNNQTLKWINSRWECANDDNTGTTYSAGTGLDLTGTTFSVKYGTIAGTAVEGNDSRLTGAFAAATSLGGDLSGTLPNPTVSRVNGIAVSSAVAGDDQKFMKYVHGAGWQPQFVKLSELKNNLGTGSAFNVGIGGCTSAQTLVWTSLTDQFNCQDIALPAAKVTGLATVATSGSYSDLSNKPTLGSLAAKNTASLTADVSGVLPIANGGTGANSVAQGLIFASPTGSTGAPSFRAIASSDLPSDVKYWTAATGGINYAGGNVGIGISSPQQLLHLYSASTAGSGIMFDNADAGGKQYKILSTGSANTGGAGLLSFIDNVAGPRMVINSSGNVGIGTTTPSEKLTVNGTVKADSVKLAWVTKTTANTNDTLATGSNVFLDVSGGAITLNLPATPGHGDTIKFVHAAGTMSTNNVTLVAGAGDTITGDANLILDINHGSIEVIFFDPDQDGNGDWRIM